MSKIIGSHEEASLRQELISQCIWSETYSSLKHILKRTANQLPLLVSFLNTDDSQQTANDNYQTIYFFQRNNSNKLLFTPLRQNEDQPDLFDIYPHHCTFVMPEYFKGLFEFVLNGKRCGRIYSNLEQLIGSMANYQYSIVFMSRDRVLAFFQDSSSARWSSKEYPQGAIFRAERIHRSTVSTSNGQMISNDYLECVDEDGYFIFLKMNQPGRYSIIATSLEQQENQPEIYLHSTQAENIGQLIKRVTLYYDTKKNNNCIRLVRGSVPHNFICQYFSFVRQHTYDMLVGLTQEGLVVEWNLDSHVPCRYATNLNEILDNIHGTRLERTLASFIDQAQIHYKDNFQFDIQLVSSHDWTAFCQYWKWTGHHHQRHKDNNNVTYQSRHRFHLIASAQDLSDNTHALILAFKQQRNPSHNASTTKENDSTHSLNTLPTKQKSFFSHMSKLISSPSTTKRNHFDRTFRQSQRMSVLLPPNSTNPFDDSIYESNPSHHRQHLVSKDSLMNRDTQKTKHT